MEQQINKLTLLTVSSSNYFNATAVMLASWMEHNRSMTDRMFIIDCGLTVNQRQQLSSHFEKLDFITPDTKLTAKIRTLQSAGFCKGDRGNRFYSLQAFDSAMGLEKVIYCDSDILFTDAMVFDLPDNLPLAACPEACQLRGNVRNKLTYEEHPAQQPGLRQSFNAGLLMINMRYLPCDTYQKLINRINTEHWQFIVGQFTDQVILNQYFENQCLILDSSFNYLLQYEELLTRKHGLTTDQAVALHYNGPQIKPWVLSNHSPQKQLRNAVRDALKTWLFSYQNLSKSLSLDPLL